MPKFNSPEPMNFSNPSEWTDWVERFSRYRLASKLDKDDEIVQISALIYCMGKEAEHVFKSFVFENADDRDNYEPVLRKFNDYFIPKRNVVHERAKFHHRTQGKGESVEQYVRSLYELAEHCKFADKDEQIRDQIVIGILDRDLSEKLQLNSELTLKKAVERVRQSEQVKLQVKSQVTQAQHIEAVGMARATNQMRYNRSQGQMRGRGQGYPPANRGRGQGQPRNSYRGKGRGTQSNRQSRRCNKCNLHHASGFCYAKGKTCRKCGKYDHFAVCCYSVNEVMCDENSYEGKPRNELFLGSVTGQTTHISDDQRAWEISLSISGKSLTFKIDSGADTSVISELVYNSLCKPKLDRATSSLFGPGGKLHCLGKFIAETTYKDQSYRFPIHVVKGTTNNLLGRSAASALGLLLKVDGVDSTIFANIGLLNCEPVKITLKENAHPYCLTNARRVPFPIMSKVQSELDRLEKEDIIQKVKRPTDWCAPMVPVIKRNGSVRICVDLKKLNEAVKREHFMLPNLDDIAPCLAGSTVFSKLDASSGFHQIPLHMDSYELTTFITPFGRYCFKRIPFGITSAPEIFQRKMTELLSELDGVEVIIDDVLIHGSSQAEHDARLNAVLKRIHESGLRLNRDKCEFRKLEIAYFGQVINSQGIQPSPDRVEAIKALPAPTNVKELRRLIGMIQYLGRFIPDLATLISPMTDLLKADISWTWDHTQQSAFTKVKDMITKAPVLTYYDQSKPIVVSADASSYGLGAALFQIEKGELKPVAFSSRKLTSAEENYAQIEKECLASLFACEKFSRYLVGLDSFVLYTDHKPLVPLLNNRDLDRVPIRCQRMLMRLRAYNLQAEHVPGKLLVIPDTLSRQPLEMSVTDSKQVVNMIDEVEFFTTTTDSLRPISDRRIAEIQVASENDPLLQEVMNHTRYGWPTYTSQVKPDLRDYFNSRNELSISQGLLLYRSRLVIPEAVRPNILKSIHEGHLGLNKCRARAQASVWWPSIAKDVKTMIEHCKFCQEHRPSQRREPLKITPLPERPWVKVAADLCEEKGRHFLVLTDYYSRFLEIAYLPSITSAQVIGKLQNIFARWGIPEELISDNGTQFSSEAFKQFAERYGFRQTFSSPHYPQANGEAESAVKIAKNILRQEDIFAALMSYRATPIAATGVSPAEMIMGRKIRTLLPTLPETLKPEWPDFDRVRSCDAKYKERMREAHDKRFATRPLATLDRGDQVCIKNDKEKSWNATGTVREYIPNTRSYVVETRNGSFRRNRRFLQRVPNQPYYDDTSEHDTEISLDFDDFDNVPVAKIRKNKVPDSNSDPAMDSETRVQSPLSASGQTVTRSGRVINKPKRFQD